MYLAAKFKSTADQVTDNLDNNKQEDSHEFWCAYVDIFTKNVYAIEYYTYKNLKRIITDRNLVAFSGNKESRVVIMNKTGYQNNLQEIV